MCRGVTSPDPPLGHRRTSIFVWVVTACLEMKAHGLGHMFLGCNGFASYAQRVHWAMRDMLSLSAQNYKILGHSGLIFSKGQRQ